MKSQIGLMAIGLCVLFLAVPVFAQEISSLAVTYEVNSQSVNAKYNLQVSNISALELLLPLDARAISVTADHQFIPFTVADTPKFKKLSINPSTPLTGSLLVSFESLEFMHFSNRSFFLAELRVPSNTQSVNVTLQLDPGITLAEPAAAEGQTVFPSPSNISTDGRLITVEWKNDQLPKESVLVFLAFLNVPSANSLIVPVLAIIVIIAFAGLGLYFRKRKPLPVPPTQLSTLSTSSASSPVIPGSRISLGIPGSSDSSPSIPTEQTSSFEFEGHLLDKEKTVIDALKTAPNFELKQNFLQQHLGFSKAKMSRTVHDLEQRGIVKVMPHGNTNIIKLIEKF